MIYDQLEAKLAMALRLAGILFVHEKDDPKATKGLDFFLPQFKVYLEVKGGYSDRVMNQMQRDFNVIVIQGMHSIDFIVQLLKPKDPLATLQ